MSLRSTVRHFLLHEGYKGEKRTYTVEGDKETLDRFERFMKHLHYCSNVGHSATVAMSIDGDGAERLMLRSPDPGHVNDREVRRSKPNEVEIP